MSHRLAYMATAALALGLMSPAPANAEATATVKAPTTQRMNGPNLNSGQDGVYKAGQVLTLVCHTTGEPVKGFFSFNIPNGGWDNLWYKTSDNHYVADVDIETHTLNSLGPDCPNGGGGGVPASGPSGDRAAQALAWARQQMAKNPYNTVECEVFVEQAYHTKFPGGSAMELFTTLHNQHKTNDDPNNIPAGALVFTSDPTFDGGAGHVMLSEGNGKYITANYLPKKDTPHIREVPLNSGDPRDKFLGWAYAP